MSKKRRVSFLWILTKKADKGKTLCGVSLLSVIVAKRDFLKGAFLHCFIPLIHLGKMTSQKARIYAGIKNKLLKSISHLLKSVSHFAKINFPLVFRINTPCFGVSAYFFCFFCTLKADIKSAFKKWVLKKLFVHIFLFFVAVYLVPFSLTLFLFICCFLFALYGCESV